MALEKSYTIRIRSAIHARGMSEDDKKELVLSATDGRTDSIRAMHTSEAIALLSNLNGQADNYEPGTKQKMKRKVLAIAHDLGWELPDGKVDMKRVNGYCLTRSEAKKTFNDLTVKELESVVKQFQQMKRVYLKGK